MVAVILIGLLVLCIVFGPIAGIWALNTIFGMTIAYTFKTWMAALVLCVIIAGGNAGASRK